MLKEEMRRFGSLLMACADQCAVPAGGRFGCGPGWNLPKWPPKKIEAHPLITVVHEEVTKIPKEGCVVVATGPLTADALAQDIFKMCGGGLSFLMLPPPLSQQKALTVLCVLPLPAMIRARMTHISIAP